MDRHLEALLAIAHELKAIRIQLMKADEKSPQARFSMERQIDYIVGIADSCLNSASSGRKV
ncbi:MAG TPA: hypothetical protein VN622_11030 [Clostridia bacterium]|nr:hypothetical protein [Clostridia bacterium]